MQVKIYVVNIIPLNPHIDTGPAIRLAPALARIFIRSVIINLTMP